MWTLIYCRCYHYRWWWWLQLIHNDFISLLMLLFLLMTMMITWYHNFNTDDTNDDVVSVVVIVIVIVVVVVVVVVWIKSHTFDITPVNVIYRSNKDRKKVLRGNVEQSKKICKNEWCCNPTNHSSRLMIFLNTQMVQSDVHDKFLIEHSPQ